MLGDWYTTEVKSRPANAENSRISKPRPAVNGYVSRAELQIVVEALEPKQETLSLEEETFWERYNHSNLKNAVKLLQHLLSKVGGDGCSEIQLPRAIRSGYVSHMNKARRLGTGWAYVEPVAGTTAGTTACFYAVRRRSNRADDCF